MTGRLTNEELATRIQQGEREAVSVLWAQTYRLIFALLKGYYPLCARCGIEPEDLQQSGFFALLRAVEAYDPARGYAFNSYLKLHVSNVAREALGFTDSRTKLPPSCLSLDAPLDEAIGEATLADSIPDPAADFADALIDREATRQNIAALRAELERLPYQPRQAVLHILWEGKTLKGAAACMGLSTTRIQQLKEQGLRKLRSSRTARTIQRELFPPRHVSLASFRVHHTSEQEKYLLRLEELSERRSAIEQ